MRLHPAHDPLSKDTHNFTHMSSNRANLIRTSISTWSGSLVHFKFNCAWRAEAAERPGAGQDPNDTRPGSGDGIKAAETEYLNRSSRLIGALRRGTNGADPSLPGPVARRRPAGRAVQTHGMQVRPARQNTRFASSQMFQSGGPLQCRLTCVRVCVCARACYVFVCVCGDRFA